MLTYVSQRICRNTRSMKLKWLRPIPEVWIPLYLLLFVAFTVAGFVFRAVEEASNHARGDIVGFTNSMIDGAGSIILVSATISTTIVEGALIFAERYLKHRYEVGKEEGVEVGREEGIELGVEVGVGQERQRWVDWMARKQAADEAGELFDEPPPGQAPGEGRNGL